MRLIKNGLFGLGVMASVFFVSAPAQAAALTTNQVNAILMLLQSFGADQSVISSVQTTLTNGSGALGTSSLASSTLPLFQRGDIPMGKLGKALCIALNRNLGIGSEGDDVRHIQEMLQQDPTTGFTASSTGFFGPQTAKAMARFQIKHGIASTTTGSVGPMTRGFFEKACGEGLNKEENNKGFGTTTKQERGDSREGKKNMMGQGSTTPPRGEGQGMHN